MIRRPIYPELRGGFVVSAFNKRQEMYRAQRSSSNGAKEQLQQAAKEQQKGANRSSSFYSATNRFVIVLEPSVHFV